MGTIGLIVGLLMVNLIQPGAGMNGDPASLDTKGIAAYTGPGKMQSTTEFLLAATLAAVGTLPVAGLALNLGIDRFMSEARALTNLIGNGVATVVVGKWCGDLDAARMRSVLDRESAEEADEPEKLLDRMEERMPADAKP